MTIPPARPLSYAVRDLKTNSSRWMAEHGTPFAWQEGFGAFTVSPSQVAVVKKYIRSQPEHHKGRNVEEEFLLLLKKSGISYNPKHVFG
jgi:putative transposase